MATVLLYGCYGYTGRLLADEALARGMKPILAGRRREAVEAMGRALDLPTRVFGLDDPAKVGDALDGVHTVLHAAGPFVYTSKPMAKACLAKKAHYLDVTGEMGVFESLHARDDDARAAGITIMPGVGFDVVPFDCLAAYVASKLPDATELTIGLQMVGGFSQGTALTMLTHISAGGAVRRDGQIVSVPAAHATRDIDFGDGPKTCVAIPWGDVSTAYYSTGVPNIEVYLAAPSKMRIGMAATRVLAPLLATKRVQRFVSARIKDGPPGPTPEQRARGASLLWAEAKKDGQRVAARLRTVEAYTLTAQAGIRAAEKVLAGGVPVGFQTPSRGLGVDFVLEVPGTTRTDV